MHYTATIISATSQHISVMVGDMVIDWLISEGKVRNRHEGVMLATGLLNEGYLQPAGELSKTAVESNTESAFLDETDAMYYFVSEHANL